MRSTFRLLASVKPARYLEAGTPTGLTGLFTHPSPRSTLVYLYSRTLDAISEFPETSLYRQSTEALTKHRLNIVSAVEPEGYKEWSAKAKQIVSENPEAFARQDKVQGKDVSLAGKMTRELSDGKEFIKRRVVPEYDEREVEWDGEKALKGGVEVGTTVGFEDGTKKLELPEEPLLTVAHEGEVPFHDEIFWSVLLSGLKNRQMTITNAFKCTSEFLIVSHLYPVLLADWVLEIDRREHQANPRYRIEEIENKIGAGLIEEVIQVAEGELKLVDVLKRAEVWQDLEEKPVEGQWSYFMRDTATPTT
ncbi:NADH-ubiquinone oxidoreductase 29.9 kDa subunit [Lachnellula arida]|uniref:NADH-ubiquinone oxidoreductase 29.9 kDa subunit n=1 Tax=Lachnellula arida TaxID=1316785 RepID=A0A8T9B8F0_9HELO|nr:NADH-ubiquinone oxidoreductase 29.9 kDa subunit [Lachnellula arida]